MSDGIEHIEGPAAIAAWDQNHARAMSDLRRCEAYVLVTLSPETGQLRFQATSRDLKCSEMIDMLMAAGETAVDSGVEMAQAYEA
jgi:hypothetical protein